MSQRREFLKTAGVVTASALISRQPLVANLAGGEDALDFGSDHLALQASSAGPAAPMGLLVNGAKNPLAIDRDATRFTWRAVGTGRGEMQTAFQILVSSNHANSAAGTEIGGTAEKSLQTNRLQLNTRAGLCRLPRGFGGKYEYGTKRAGSVLIACRHSLALG